MDTVMGFKDNIHPPLLINSNTDFSSFDPDSPSRTPEETGDDDSSLVDIHTTVGTGPKTTVRTLLRKKRKHSESSPDPKVIEILQEKWEKDQEKIDVDLALKKQFMEETKRENEEFLACFKGIAESVAKLAKN